MEDLRKQKQNQWITTVGNTSLWTINMNKQDLFNEVSTRSLYIVGNNPKVEVKSDSLAIMDDDRNLYDRYAEVAIQDLLVLLARRIPQSRCEYAALFGWKEGDAEDVVVNDETMLEFSLVMGENHDRNLLNALVNACKEYLVCRILSQWFSSDFGVLEQERRITHVLQYRRKSPARRVRPLL